MFRDRALNVCLLAAAALAIPQVASATVPEPINVPEPSIAILLAAGGLTVAAVRRYRGEE